MWIRTRRRNCFPRLVRKRLPFPARNLFARLKPQVEGKGAAWAVAHRIAKVVWLVLHQEVEYREKGSAPPNERTLLRKFKRILKDFGRLGLDVRA